MNGEFKKLPVSVLIVDDEALIVEQLGQILRRRVETLYSAYNGKEALEYYRNYPIDVIVTDIDMPVMNGIELLKAVRRNDKKIPVILSTGLKSLDILIEAIEYGITSFLPKPLQKNDLVAKIEEVARTKELEHKVSETGALLEQYKSIVDESVIVSKADLNGNIIYVNDIFCIISGFSREELLGKPHSIVRDPEMPSSVFANMWETIQSKHVWHGIINNRSKNGNRYTVKTTISPILDKNGAIIEYIALREDITDTIQKEKVIRRERKKLVDILDHVDSIVALVSVSEKLISVNARFFEIFAFSDMADFKTKHQCIGDLFQPAEEYLQPEMEGRYWIEYVMEKPFISHHALMIDREGNERKFLVNVKKILIEEEEKFVVTMGDVSELQKAREAANAAAKMKGEFLATMSHEIRTPMNGVLGFTSLLSQSGLNEQQKKYLDIINTSAQSLLGIINDILDFSKLESGKLELDYSSVNPHIEFDKIARIFTAMTVDKNITFEIKVDPLISECIRVDLLRIQQIVSNLLSNAVKFTPKDGSIVFFVERLGQVGQKSKIRLGVRDTGIGIAPEHKQKIFEAFSQADSSTTRKFGGTGLGLSISSHLVSLMGGQLMVESEEGQGSEFSFEIDVNQCHAEHPLSSYFISRYVTLFHSRMHSEEENRIKTYLDKLHVPYRVMSPDEGLKIDRDGIYVFFCDTPAEIAQALLARGGVTGIVIGSPDEVTFDGERITWIKDLEHNLSALYNVLLSAVNEQSLNLGEYGTGSGSFSGKVLVAEDNPVNQMLIQEYLGQYGLQPVVVENGQQAVERLRSEKYDLVLMDVNMPILSGVDALNIIKLSNIRTPIVALTANAMEGDSERFLAMGFDHYLAKPVHLEELENILKIYLEYHASECDHSVPVIKTRVKTSIVDLDRMRSELQLPDAVLHKLLSAFVQSFESAYAALHEAVRNKNLSKIEETAHYIKGSAGNLRIYEVESMAKELEVLAKLKAPEECQEVFSELQNMKEALIDEIRRILETRTPLP